METVFGILIFIAILFLIGILKARVKGEYLHGNSPSDFQLKVYQLLEKKNPRVYSIILQDEKYKKVFGASFFVSFYSVNASPMYVVNEIIDRVTKNT